MTIDSYASPWKKLAAKWETYYSPPGRPSANDQEIYSHYISEALDGKPGRALVLGATPEIRHVLHTFPIEVTVLDINEEMIAAMNSFVPGTDKDKQVVGSWVKNDLPSDYFDLILGDFSWSNVPRADWPVFHTTLRRVLKESGKYIQRAHVIPDGWPFRPTLAVLEEFGSFEYTPQLPFEMFFELLTNTYEEKTGDVSMNRIWQAVSPFWVQGKWVGEAIPGAGPLLDKLFAFWGTTEKTWDVGPADRLEEELSPYFTVLEERRADDYRFTEVTPFWYCQKV